MPAQKKFPITLKNKYGKVSVYKTVNGSYTAHKIVWKDGRVRRKESIADESAAVLRAKQILDDLTEHGSMSYRLGPSEWSYYQACLTKLDGVPLMDAVDYYLTAHKTRENKAVEDVVAEFLDAKRSVGCGGLYLSTLQTDLNLVVNAFRGRPIVNITGEELDALLNTVQGLRTRKNKRTSIVSCWEWAVGKQYLPDCGTTAARRTNNPAAPTKDPGFLLPEQLKEAFDKAARHLHGGWLVPYLAIGAFAGVRAAELNRMTWENNIDLEQKVIILGSDTTKTKRRRVVPMEPELFAVLSLYKSVGKVVTAHSPDMVLKSVRGQGWPHNALRHSAVSYLMARHQNAAKVAEMCGHSESVLQSCYKAAVTPAAAEAWFGLTTDAVFITTAAHGQTIAYQEPQESDPESAGGGGEQGEDGRPNGGDQSIPACDRSADEPVGVCVQGAPARGRVTGGIRAGAGESPTGGSSC